jgi:hypothetical protein
MLLKMPTNQSFEPTGERYAALRGESLDRAAQLKRYMP